jgi:malate dehydrogenase
VTCRGGQYQIVQNLSVDEFSRAKLLATELELREERDGVKDLLG